MPSRTRSRDRAATSAGYVDLVYNGTVYSHTAGYAGAIWHQTCDDTTDVPPFVVPHPLVILDNRAVPPMKLSGNIPYAPLPILVSQYRDFTVANRAGWSYCPAITAINWAYWQTKALANLNPSRSSVDILNFLFEFKDLPGMWRNLGEVLSKHRSAKDFSNGYLAYSFGWAPLVSDLKKLWALTQDIEKRCAYLRRLENGTYIRRTIGDREVQHTLTVDGHSVTDAGGTYLVQSDVRVREFQKVWFTCNAKLLNPLPDASNMRAEVTRILLGLTPGSSYSIAWNALPWSWLLDYFANIGDFLEAQRGHFVLSIPHMNIMCTSRIDSTLERVRVHASITCTGGRTLRTVAKQRYVVYQPVPWLALDPILSWKQVANLGALITSRALGSSGRIAR
jgi:hypothetical protein